MKTFSRFLLLVAGVVIASALNVSAQTTVAIAATDADAAETLPGAPANPGSIRLTRTGSTSDASTAAGNFPQRFYRSRPCP